MLLTVLRHGRAWAAAGLIALVSATSASSRPAAGFSITASPPAIALNMVGSGGTRIYNIAVGARWSPDALHDEVRVRFRLIRGLTSSEFGGHDSGNVLHSSAAYRNTFAAEPGTRAHITADWTVYTPQVSGRVEGKKTSPIYILILAGRERAPRLNSTEKDANSAWARRSAAVCGGFTAGGAVLLAVPGGQAVALAVLAAGGLGCGAALAFNSLAQDPVDPNFRAIAKPTSPPAPKVSAGAGFPAAAAAAFNRLFDVQAREIGLTRAILTAFNRSQGAHVKKATAWEEKQVRAAGGYAAELSMLMLQEVKLRRGAARFLDLEPLSEDDAYAFGDGLLVGGQLPAQFTSVLSRLGLTRREQAETRALIASTEPAIYAGDAVNSFTGVQTIAELRKAAMELKSFSKRAARDPLAIP